MGRIASDPQGFVTLLGLFDAFVQKTRILY